MKKVIDFLRNEEGLETVEYGVILGLIVAGTIGAVLALGTWVNGQFVAVNTAVGA